MRSSQAWAAVPLSMLAIRGVAAGQILSTEGFSTCINDPTITVQNMNITYNKATNLVVFNVAGSSSEVQNVTASIAVTAYGEQVYSKTFDPCDTSTYVKQLCPGKSSQSRSITCFI